MQPHCFAAENNDSFPSNLRLAELKGRSPLPQMLTSFSVPYFPPWECGAEDPSVFIQKKTLVLLARIILAGRGAMGQFHLIENS